MFIQSVWSGPNWYQIGKKAIFVHLKLASFTSNKDVYVNRLESVFFELWMCISQNTISWKGGIPLNWILKALKWNKPKDRAQRVDEENGVICLAIMFTSRVMAFKMSEMAIFFSPDNSKILVTSWAISLSTRGRSLCPNWVCFFSIQEKVH